MKHTLDAIEEHIPALRRYAWALVRDRDRADDLVQDCLERAIGRWSSRRDDGNLRAWLFTILHNLHISAIRQTMRRGPHVALEDSGYDPPVAPEAEHHVAANDALAAIALLPLEQRAVLLLVGVEELTYEEAAKVLGVPLGTIMSRLSRGRERLHALLESGGAAPLRRVK